MEGWVKIGEIDTDTSWKTKGGELVWQATKPKLSVLINNGSILESKFPNIDEVEYADKVNPLSELYCTPIALSLSSPPYVLAQISFPFSSIVNSKASLSPKFWIIPAEGLIATG